MTDPPAAYRVVIVMMENRSFDHMLGWVPGADGVQAGLRYPDKKGRLIETFPLAGHPEYGFQGCGKEDPDHGYDGGRRHLNDGRMDGWLATVGDVSVDSDHFPIGYYRREDLPFFAGCADHWTICDRYFHGILASTFPNRIYLHAGETDRTSNTIEASSLPTIWDRLSDAGVSGRYYFHDLPVTALWAAKYLALSTRFEQFLLDAAMGTLPSVSIVDPRFVGEAPNGISNDDHPQADVRNGQSFMNSVYDALRNSPQWEKSLLVIVYDEWGGFYDHVVPPVAPVSAAEGDPKGAVKNDGRLGFRTPCILIGPRAPRRVSSLQLDVNSVLNMLCWRWRLPPLGARGSWSLNMAYALDFDSPPRTEAPAIDVGLGPFGQECVTGLPFPIPQLPGSPGKLSAAQIKQAQHNLEWLQLGELARAHGFIR
jgi:phospholipase C